MKVLTGAKKKTGKPFFVVKPPSKMTVEEGGVLCIVCDIDGKPEAKGQHDYCVQKYHFPKLLYPSGHDYSVSFHAKILFQ